MKIEKLPAVCKIQYGYPFDSALFSEKEGNPLIRIRDVVRGYTETYTTEKCSDEYLVNKGDILIGMDGIFNVAKWKGSPAFLNQRVCRLIPGEKIDSEYLYYFMPKALKKIEEATPFVTVKHLKAKQLNNIQVPMVPLLRQKQIAQQLVTIDHLRECRKKQLQKLDELVKSRFIEMFGDLTLNTMNWEGETLEELSDIVSGITKGRKTKSENLIEVPYMAVSNVKNGYIDWTTVKKIFATQKEIEQYRLLPGDILMTEGGDPDKVGRGAIIKNPLKNCIHQNHIFRVRLNKKYILPVFFEEYLKSAKTKNYFLRCAKQTTGIASINMKQLKALPVLLPNLKYQQEFANFKICTDKSKLAIQKSLDDLETLKKSLMQQYFG